MTYNVTEATYLKNGVWVTIPIPDLKINTGDTSIVLPKEVQAALKN